MLYNSSDNTLIIRKTSNLGQKKFFFNNWNARTYFFIFASQWFKIQSAPLQLGAEWVINPWLANICYFWDHRSIALWIIMVIGKCILILALKKNNIFLLIYLFHFPFPFLLCIHNRCGLLLWVFFSDDDVGYFYVLGFSETWFLKQKKKDKK